MNLIYYYSFTTKNTILSIYNYVLLVAFTTLQLSYHVRIPLSGMRVEARNLNPGNATHWTQWCGDIV